MRTKIKWAELHSPLFLAGANLQMKLDPEKRKGLSMEYDEEKHQLYVTFNGHTARVPEPSILSMIEYGDAPVPSKGATTPVSRKIVAQVSTPQSHVFEGVGATGQKTKF